MTTGHLPSATFIILADDATDDTQLHHACLQAAKAYRQQQRVFIYTQDQDMAHRIDDLLWSAQPDSFIPHNLPGEGPRNGAAVEISWQLPTNRRQVLINLTSTVPHFADQYSHIIDFVPADDVKKQQARERFRTLRQYGVVVETIAAEQSTTTQSSNVQTS